MLTKKIFIYRFLKFIPKKIVNFLMIYKYRLNYNLEYLKKKGIKFNTIYDIGAYHGDWSDFYNHTSLKNCFFYLFEANKKNEKIIKKKNFPYFIGVLSDKIKKVNFYSKNHSGDSYYLEMTNFYKKNFKPKNLTTNTLDKIVKKQKLKLPDFIKIDTQGSEIDILKGAKYSLSKCSAIYLECPIVDYNKKAPNLKDYINYLNKINFVPYDICEIHYIDKVVVQIDILFLKKGILKKLLDKKPILKLFSNNFV